MCGSGGEGCDQLSQTQQCRADFSRYTEGNGGGVATERPIHRGEEQACGREDGASSQLLIGTSVRGQASILTVV